MSSNLSRRDFLILSILAGITILQEPRVLLSQERKHKKVISDPDILPFYETQVEHLKKGEIDYNCKETFNPYFEMWLKVKKYVKENGLTDDGVYHFNQSIPEELRSKLESLYNFHISNELKQDDFSDIENLEEYIRKNQLDHSQVLDSVNNNQVVLIGESHINAKHTNLEFRLVFGSKRENLVYIDESFQIDRETFFKSYMDGDNSALEDIAAKLLDPGEIRGFLKFLRQYKIPIVLADFCNDLEKRVVPDFDPKFVFTRRDSVRESIFARQISYAVKKSNKLIGSFGGLHLRPDNLPKYLKKEGIIPLIISGSDFTSNVYNTALDVSNGEDIYFKREDKIIFVAEGLRWYAKSRESWLSMKKVLDKK